MKKGTYINIITDNYDNLFRSLNESNLFVQVNHNTLTNSLFLQDFHLCILLWESISELDYEIYTQDHADVIILI